MKNISKTLGSILMLISVILSGTNQLSGQDKVTVSAGAGFAETLNIGMRYQFHQSQIGFSIGTWPSSSSGFITWKSLVSLSGDYYFHLGDSTKFSSLHPWYVRVGLDYLRIGTESSISNNIDFHLRFGRDCYISTNSGISLDAGIAEFLKNDTGIRKPAPAFGFCLFFKF
jgi:hypothetical protein